MKGWPRLMRMLSWFVKQVDDGGNQSLMVLALTRAVYPTAYNR